MASWGQFSFQDSASPIMNLLINFHDLTLIILSVITMLVMYSLMSVMMNKFININTLDAQWVETFWTIIPMVALLFLALPSLRLLYLLDEVDEPSLTISVIGHQWYWSYEYSDFLNIEFDSYMLNEEDLDLGMFRLLEVDNRIVIPWGIKTRLLVSSADVIHSWTIPSMGIKLDAVPGRLNQASMNSLIPGVFYGQCSEICGANHTFMPIVVEVVNHESFYNWINNYIN